MLNTIEGVELNSKGYLIHFEQWDKSIAEKIAGEHDLELTDCHWIVINFLREYYIEFGIPAEPREVIKKLGKKIHPNTPCSKKHLESLFSGGGCKLACKIAGLPDCYCRGT